MTKVVLATNNQAKLAELRRIVASHNLGLEICSLKDIPSYPEPAENEFSFAGNALIKARAGCKHSGLATLADDSGLCVDVLSGMPGVRSSRWAGSGHDDQANLELVLRQIDDVDDDHRGAQFVCVMALVLPDGREFSVKGEMAGRLITEPRGDHGFGYDPIFVPDGYQLTTAEMTSEAKDAISHRGKAIQAMIPVMKDALGL